MSTEPRVPLLSLILLLMATLPLPALAESPSLAQDQHGSSHSWKPEPGAVTIVDFAASWCGPCRQTLPKLQKLADAHPEVRVLVISVDETSKGRDALVRDLGLTLPVLWDRDHSAARHYRPAGMPSTFVFDAEARPVMSYVGSKRKDWQVLVETVVELTP